MRFVAALDTYIFGVFYLQGAEVDVTAWTRRMILQYLNLGIIQASYLTAGAVTDKIDVEGNGVSQTVNGEGKVVWTVDPALADLSDVSTAGLSDGDGLFWDEADELWKPGEGGGGGGGGSGVLLLEYGGSVPGGTASGTLIFEKAQAPTVWDFRLGSLPAGWAKHGTPTETFSGAGMAMSSGAAAGHGYHIDGVTLPVDFTLELCLLTQSTVASVMFGPHITNTSGTGVGASWYNSPNALLSESMSAYAYSSTFQQVGAGPPVYPNRIRLRRSSSLYYASYSSDGGSNWSPETPSQTNGTTVTRLGFGNILATAVTATVEQVIMRPGSVAGSAGRAKGWWDGSALQPLS